MFILNNPKWVSKTPFLTLFFLEWANVSQIVRMWSEKSSEGQSILGWTCVLAALVLWFNFYRVCTPDQVFAKWATAVGVLINSFVIFSVVYWRYYGN